MEVTHTQLGELLTVSQAAKLAHFSPDTIRRYADTGKLRTYRTPGNQRRFRREDVLSLLTPQATPVSSAVPQAEPAGASVVRDVA